jgi:hypothetical protein
MPLMNVTDDEFDLINQMREWKDGIPDEAVGQYDENPIYVHLVAARAELYLLSLRHPCEKLMKRHDAFHKLLGPNMMIKLCKSWHDLRDRKREDEYAEAGLEH